MNSHTLLNAKPHTLLNANPNTLLNVKACTLLWPLRKRHQVSFIRVFRALFASVSLSLYVCGQ